MSINKFSINFRSVTCLAFLLSFINSSIISQSGWYALNSGTSSVLKSIFFINGNTGFMVGDGIVLKTVNSGSNWSVVSNQIGGKSVQFVNDIIGYICDGTIYKTTNGGQNWINLNLTLLNSLNFLNANTGYAVGKSSQILKTTNGGMSWENQFVSLVLCEFYAVRFFNESTGFIAGGKMHPPYFGLIYKTTDGGATWLLDFSNAPDITFTGISFPNNLTGYVVGKYEYGSSGVIYKTTNCGESWIQQGIVNRDLNAVFFSNSNTGYAVGEQGMILKTTNGSIVWNTQVSSSNHDLYSVYFIREPIGFTAGAGGVVQKTVNGGLSGPPFAISGKVLKPNGQPVTSGYVKALKYNINTDVIQVLDSAAIQLNGDYILPNLPVDTVDIMAYPNDTEENINPPLFVPTYYTGTDIGTIYWRDSRKLFVNKNLFERNITVLLTSGIGGIQTIGGGVFSAPPNLNALRGAIVYAMVGNEFRGFGISRTNGIYAANFLAPGTYTMICDRMGYRDAQRSVILGNFNIDTINFYLTHINLIGIKAISDKIPFSYEMGQNYPNPFNPHTKFKVDIPYESDVNITVFDMLGRVVEILFDSRLNSGSYIFDWDASAYSSGIYFYRINASARNNPGYRFADVKKMILMK